MGFYIEGPLKDKEVFMHHEYGAESCVCPKSYSDIPKGKALICIIDNGPFEAAGFCFDEEEFEEFIAPDPRPRSYVLINRTKAEELSGFTL